MSYSEVVSLLKQMETTEVNEAQKQLSELSFNNPSILQPLFTVLQDQDLDGTNMFITEWVKVIAACFITNAICEDIFHVSQSVYKMAISRTLQSFNISPQVKRSLQRAIVYLIDTLDESTLPFSLVELIELRELTFKLFEANELRDTAYLLIGCFCVPTEIDLQHVIYLVRMFMGPGLGSVLGGQNGDFALAKQYSEMVKCWIVAWDRLAREPGANALKSGKEQKFKNPEACKVLEQIVKSNEICSAIIQLYTWQAQSPIFICTTKQLYELNSLKEQISELHYRALQYCQKKGIIDGVYLFTENITGNIVNNLVLIANNPKGLDEYQCKSFVTNLVKVLRFYFLCNPAQFRDSWKGLLDNVIFPFIEPDSQELEAYAESPHDFMALFEDCSEKQTFGLLKSENCKLLEKLCDKSQVVTQDAFIFDFVVEFAIDSIKNSLGESVPNVYAIKFVSFDVGIQVLSVFSYRLQSHKRILELAQVFTKENYALMTDYQRCRVYQFLSYNYAQVYPTVHEGQFWISAALLQKSTQSSIACANDMLFNVADDFYSDYFLQALKQKICDNQDGLIWNALEKLVNVQFAKISEALMLELIAEIYNRLDAQFSAISSHNIKQTLNAIKLIQILHTISQKQSYLEENKGIAPVLWKIVNAYDRAEEYSFEDEIIRIVYELVKIETVISQNSIQALSWFVLNKFAKRQYGCEQDIKLLNCYIMHGEAGIVPSILKALQTGIIFHFMNIGETTAKKSERRMIHANLLLLLQNLLAIHGKCLTQQNIIEIFSITNRYLPSMGQGIDSPVVLARALNVLLLCHMYCWTESTWGYIQNYCGEVYTNYDIRVLIACVEMQVYRQQNLSILGKMLGIVGTAISGFRNRQKANAKAIKVQKKCQTTNRLKPLRYKQFEKIVKEIETPFKSQTKLQVIFTNLLEKLKDKNIDLYSQMISHISPNLTKVICQICGFDSGNLLERRRVHYTMLKPKLPVNVVEEDEEEMVDSEEEEFKRKRVAIKKTGKGKKNVHNGKIEME